MKGMAQNTIAKPTFYHFLGQDSIHLKNGEKILRETANNANVFNESLPDDRLFIDVLTEQAAKYRSSYEAMDKQLLMSKTKVDPMNIEPDPATEAYFKFLTTVSGKHPRLLVFAFLPCSQSFRFIANQYVKNTQLDPVYEKFFLDNYRKRGYKSGLENFVDERFPLDSLELELFKVIEEIYLEGMKQEKNFIDQAAL